VEQNPEVLLLPVAALSLENGIMFHSKVIGLDRFLVPADKAIKDGFLLAPPSKN